MKKPPMLLLILMILTGCGTTNTSPKNGPTLSRPSTFSLLPHREEQLQALRGAAFSGAAFVTVEFGGLMCHIRGIPSPRIVAIDDANHETLLFLPGAAAGPVIAVFGSDAACDASGCIVRLDRVGLRLRSVTGAVSINRLTSPAARHFDPLVPKLGRYITNLKDEVDDEIASGIVRAYFDLSGGTLEAVAHPCLGKYEGEPDSEFRQFVNTAALRLTFDENVILEVRKATGTVWEQIPLGSGQISLAMGNVSAMRVSHFRLYEGLSRDAVTLPDVVMKPCITFFGGVPGCGNTQWP